MAEEKRLSVLVVDDTEENVDILLETLDEDYDVMVALNGPDALELVDEEVPDIILLDIMMPGMDGYEVCTRLKSQESTRDVPIIFITALSEAGNETKGLEMGAIDYITKPFNPAIVKVRVKNQLELRKAIKLREDVGRITRHDLKNPLQDVISLPQLMQMTGDNLTDSQKDMLDRVEAAGKTMLQMINKSLDVFKMEQGTYVLNPEDADLARAVRDCMDEFAPVIRSKEVDCTLSVDGVPQSGAGSEGASFVVRGEYLLLYSMCANLLRNALEASPDGETIAIEVLSGPPARLNMTNRGAIPVDMRERFFQKYATSGKQHGTGLGTYSARLIAEVHGGGIGFTVSDEEDTTQVSVTLP